MQLCLSFVQSIALQDGLLNRPASDFQPGSYLCLERAAATATLRCIRILECEALLFQTLVPVDSGSVEVQGTLLVDNDGNAVTLVLGVGLIVKGVVKIQGVAEATAATCGNADSQYHVVTEVVLFLEPLDLFRCSFAQFDCHLLYYPSSWTRIGRFEIVEVPLSEYMTPEPPYY